jgi:hypothetical protein
MGLLTTSVWLKVPSPLFLKFEYVPQEGSVLKLSSTGSVGEEKKNVGVTPLKSTLKITEVPAATSKGGSTRPAGDTIVIGARCAFSTPATDTISKKVCKSLFIAGLVNRWIKSLSAKSNLLLYEKRKTKRDKE